MTKYNPILSQNRINEMIESGLWANLPILAYFQRAVSENPEKGAIISYITETGENIKIE